MPVNNSSACVAQRKAIMNEQAALNEMLKEEQSNSSLQHNVQFQEAIKSASDSIRALQLQYAEMGCGAITGHNGGSGPVDIDILIVMDGIGSFAPNKSDYMDSFFSASHLVDTLSSASNPIVRYHVHLAHRHSTGDPQFSVDGWLDRLHGYPNQPMPPLEPQYRSQSNFVFSAATLDSIDELWLFGVADCIPAAGSDSVFLGSTGSAGFNYLIDPVTGLTGEGQPPNILSQQMQAILNFMNSGGGVFATGDHYKLGACLCGAIPRVRSMRKWFVTANPDEIDHAYNTNAKVGPLGEPCSTPQDGQFRIDTTQPGRDFSTGLVFGLSSRAETLQQPHLFSVYTCDFDNQSDDVPQPIAPTTTSTHPLLDGGDHQIMILPDHMHEGEVFEPQDPRYSLVSAQKPGGQLYSYSLPSTKVFEEYPAGASGVRPLPQIIATSSVKAHILSDELSPIHTASDATVLPLDSFGSIGAYDGHSIQIGRVVVDSTFHHFFDINLVGDVAITPTKTVSDPAKSQGFLANRAQTFPPIPVPFGPTALVDIEQYYRNIAAWLIPAAVMPEVFTAATHFARNSHPLNKMIDPNRNYSAAKIIEFGTIADRLISRHLQPTHLAMLLYSVLNEEQRKSLPFDPHMNPGGRTQTIYTTKDHIVAALGGSVIAVARFQANSNSETHLLIEHVRSGIADGLRGLAELIRTQTAAMAENFAGYTRCLLD